MTLVVRLYYTAKGKDVTDTIKVTNTLTLN